MANSELIKDKEVFIYKTYSRIPDYGTIEHINEKWIYLKGFNTFDKWILIENIKEVKYSDYPALRIQISK